MDRTLPPIRTLLSAALLLAAALPIAAPIAAQGRPSALPGSCTAIEELPTVITEPGVYCLNRDHALDLFGGSAIEIQADHVTIDLQDHTIDNSAAGPGTIAPGISSFEQSHIVLRNGSLVGFERGVDLAAATFGSQHSVGHLVEGLRIIDSGTAGMRIAGNHSVVRGNFVRDSGVHPNGKGGISGIALGGWGNRAIENDVIRTVGPGTSIAIRFISGGSNMAIGNRITAADTAILFPTGQTGFYRDNLANEIPCCTAFEGGTDLGGNTWQ